MKNASYQFDGKLKGLAQFIEQLGYKHSSWQVFEDFVLMSACSISNSVDPLHREEREKIYMGIVKKYTHEEVQLFPQMLALLVETLEDELTVRGPTDVLGKLYHGLELHNKWKGQFFTPQNMADMMAEMALSDHDPDIERKGYITLYEPSCGSGVMVLAMAKALLHHHYNPSQHIVVTAADIDLKCVCMAYLQLSLYGIPAVVEHANSLSAEVYSRWYTPVYMLNGWLFRQHCGLTEQDGRAEDEALKCGLDPMYAAIRQVESICRTENDDDASANAAPSQMLDDMPESVAAALPNTNELTVKKNGQLCLF